MILTTTHTYVYTLFDSIFTYSKNNPTKMAYTGVHYSNTYSGYIP